jgi:hypothetical protein
MAACVQIIIFCIVKPYILFGRYQTSRGTCYLHHQGSMCGMGEINITKSNFNDVSIGHICAFSVMK